MKKLFYILLALPLAFAACEPVDEPTPEPQPEVKDPVLTLTSKEVIELGAQGGTGFITYTLENAKEGVTLEATCEAEWVENLVAGDNVVFTVGANEGEARETKVVVTYDVASFEVTVKQAAKTASTTPTIVVTSEETMEFGQEEAMGTITYTIENPVQGVNLTAKANVDWISQVTVQSEKVLFQVAANKGAAREGVITLTYGMLNANVTVKQVEYVAPAPIITVEPGSVEVESAGGAVTVAYSVANTVEGVELSASCDAEWISNIVVSADAVTFDVAANEADLRQATIVLTYAEVTYALVVKQLPEGYNPGMDYRAFTVIETFAESKQGGKQWDLTIIERDPEGLMGEMQTLICFYMPEANAKCISDGVYTVENGGILVNTANLNGFSSYRANTSNATDITAANLVVKVDTDAETISINGTFQAANVIVALDYTGAVRGMDLSDTVIGEEGYYEWKSIQKNWVDAGEFMFTATSSDNKLRIMFDILHSAGTTVCPTGTFEVAPWEKYGDILSADSKITFNNVEATLESGYVTVEHIRGGYVFTFDLTDENGRHFFGAISGAVSGAPNPEG